MSDKTKIEWTDATWNPVTGCTKVSPGCDHCYAETIAERFRGTPAYPNGFEVTLKPDKIDQPIRWERPRRIFVNSMSDLFHDDVPDSFIEQVFDVMERAHWHTFQVLTKRPGRMRSILRKRQARREDYAAQFSYCPTEAMRTSPAAHDAQRRADTPAPNIWLGVSAEDQRWADIRIPVLLDTPAAVRFVSAEPLLGPIDTGLNAYNGTPPLIDWVIVGGESGHHARPMHPAWARDLRDQAVKHGAAFHFKQWGEWLPYQQQSAQGLASVEVGRRQVHHFGGDVRTQRVGKKAAGRYLDGRTWDEYPQAAA